MSVEELGSPLGPTGHVIFGLVGRDKIDLIVIALRKANPIRHRNASAFTILSHLINLLTIMRKVRYNCHVMAYHRKVLIKPKDLASPR
jgi:hypothetical protein